MYRCFLNYLKVPWYRKKNPNNNLCLYLGTELPYCLLHFFQKGLSDHSQVPAIAT